MSGQKEMLPPNIVEVESFTDSGVVYEVDTKAGTCTCPAYVRGIRRPCKHMKSVPGLVPENPRRPTATMAMSCLIKAYRLRWTDETVKWAYYVWQDPTQRWRTCRRMFIMTGEDGLNLWMQRRAGAFMRSWRKQSLESLVRLTLQMCRTENWWARDDGRAYIRAWREALTIKEKLKMSRDEAKHELLLAAKNDDIVSMDRLFYVVRGSTPETIQDMHRWLFAVTKDMPPEARRSAGLLIDFEEVTLKDDNFSGQAIYRLARGLGDHSPVPVPTHDEIAEAIENAERYWLDPEPVPEYFLDGMHTSGHDKRFAGWLPGMWGMCKAYQHYGRLDPHDRWLKEFWQL